MHRLLGKLRFFSVFSLQFKLIAGLVIGYFALLVAAQDGELPEPPLFIPPPPERELVVPSLNELQGYDALPVEVRREVPRPVMSVHLYDEDPEKRYALINGFRGREGLPIGQELWIYQILPEGVVLRVQNQFILIEP